MRFVFWQVIPSPHQVALLRALVEAEGHEVTLVTSDELPEWRSSLGWTVPDFGGVRWHRVRDLDKAPELLRPEDSIHVLSGMRRGTLPRRALDALVRSRAVVGVMAETGDSRGLKGRARRMVCHWHAIRYAGAVQFILAIGEVGAHWYRACGFPADRIFPFGYFMPELPPLEAAPDRAGGAFVCCYAGRLQFGKGIDILLRALAPMAAYEWRLVLVGDGSEGGALRALARDLGIAGRVKFLGAMTRDAAIRQIGQSDLLVLPSRWKDGWGAVVNESLMAGVPAICTAACGAADLIGGTGRGEVVAAGSVDALRAALDRRLARGPPSPAERESIREWSRRISARTAARYLCDVVRAARGEGSRPTAPWRN